MRDRRGDITDNVIKNIQTNKVSKAVQNHCYATERWEEESVGQSSGIEPRLRGSAGHIYIHSTLINV